MSLKENVDFIKQEISAEESFMENFFKLEKFYKKYKLLLLGSLAFVFIATVGYYTNNYFVQQATIKANIAFNRLLENPNDTKAQQILKDTNNDLYEISKFIANNKANIDLTYFKQLSQYTQALEQSNTDKLANIIQQQDFLLKNFALINKAIMEIKSKDYQSAKETLKLIPQTSDVSPLVLMLDHFLLTK